MNIDVDLPALEGFEEFDEMPALVSEEFEAAPRFLAVPIDLLWRNTVHYHYPVWVYFLINTCLTGLRSSGILSREVSVFIIIGLTARRGGERKGKEEVESEYVWGGVLIRCHGRVWRRNSARSSRSKPAMCTRMQRPA